MVLPQISYTLGCEAGRGPGLRAGLAHSPVRGCEKDSLQKDWPCNGHGPSVRTSWNVLGTLFLLSKAARPLVLLRSVQDKPGNSGSGRPPSQGQQPRLAPSAWWTCPLASSPQLARGGGRISSSRPDLVQLLCPEPEAHLAYVFWVDDSLLRCLYPDMSAASLPSLPALHLSCFDRWSLLLQRPRAGQSAGCWQEAGVGRRWCRDPPSPCRPLEGVLPI